MKLICLHIALLLSLALNAQFHGAVGSSNTNAIHVDSSVFVAWAKTCQITRGLQDVSSPSIGYATAGDASDAIGKPGTNGIVSLGDGGSAILTFSTPIANGPGYDFAVFENSFNDTFLELAFVEVSSDGVNYFRFPATSNSPLIPQFDNNATMDPTHINNLAGKYRANYGTPFDLQELSNHSMLDINSITHVKLIDVVGSVNPSYGSYDSNNNLINDPWPTPFPSSGFDLDAVGVIHQNSVGIRERSKEDMITIFPNPTKESIKINSLERIEKYIILNLVGDIIKDERLQLGEHTIHVEELNSGLYILNIFSENYVKTIKLIKE